MKLIMGLPERFWAKATVQDAGYETPCLIWTSAKQKEGYGGFSLKGKDRLAHRVSFEGVVGPIPEGLEIDHLCRVTSCVNWTHLEPVTPEENRRRSRGVGVINAAKSHCANGHPYDEANTYRTGQGRRYCRICNRRAARAYKQRKKESSR